MKSNRRAIAFSLIELVTVVVIIGILAAVAIPRFANAGTKQRVDAAARRLISDLNLARQHAYQTGAEQPVGFALNDETYTFSDMVDPARPGQQYSIVLAEEPYLSAIISANFNGSPKFKYDGYGMPTYGGVIVIGAGEEQRTIIVNEKTGEAYLQ